MLLLPIAQNGEIDGIARAAIREQIAQADRRREQRVIEPRLVLHIDQAYPNCPKYIQRRKLRATTLRDRSEIATPIEGSTPDAAILAAAKDADTLFVASTHPTRGLDASHRGGHPGFIEVIAPDVSRIPDYAGNNMFNTLGNLSVDPGCGMTVLDFQRGRIHQMTGEAKLHFGTPGANDHFACTGRSWDFHIQNWRSSELPVQADWEFLDYSPYNPR